MSKDVSMEKLAIVIPAYNEEENIDEVMRDWYEVVRFVNKGNDCESFLMLLDDGSKDGTFKRMQEFAVNHPFFVPITKQNSGHGATVLQAYKEALNRNADYVFQTDSDGQTSPDEFYDFWKQRHDFDMIIGSRKDRQDGFSRIVVTKTLKFVIRHRFRVDIEDANTPFRLMNAQTLSENIELIPDGFNLSNVLLSVIYAKKNQRVKWVPITFKKRQGGVNSINLMKIIGIGNQAVKDFRELNSLLDEKLTD